MDKDAIIAALENPEGLERLYRSAPAAFEETLPDALAAMPGSILLRAWDARLSFDAEDLPTSVRFRFDVLARVAVISLVGTLLLRLPDLVRGFDSPWFYGRFGPAIVISALTAYFLAERASSRRYLAAIGITTLACVLYLAMLPAAITSDSVMLALLHVPIVFLALTGLAFAGEQWPMTVARISFIRLCGELVVYTSIILLGGIVLSVLTLTLFRLIELPIDGWYERNVVPWGLLTSPLVAAFLIDRVVGGNIRAAGLLARVFAPLFLLMTLGYLGAMLFSGRSPYADREYLIHFNGLLVLVLGITTFCLSERTQNGRMGTYDYLNMALIAVTLVIDLIALSAIAWRLFEYGLTPNRIAVLGANVLIGCNLVGIAWKYAAAVRKRQPYETIGAVVARFLSYYVLWCLIVTFTLPVLFDFS